jgi:GTPase Era involved in 16S rRNA processing
LRLESWGTEAKKVRECMDKEIAKELSLLKLAHSTTHFTFIADDVRIPFVQMLYLLVKPVCSSLYSWDEFLTMLSIEKIGKMETESVQKRCIAIIKKRYRTAKKIFSPRITHKYLFVLEVVYIYTLIKGEFKQEDFSELFKIFRMYKKLQFLVAKYADYVLKGKTDELVSFTQYTKVKGFEKTVMQLTEFIIREYTYYKLPRVNISVLATMSAGKSTFVNALLGNDYLPSRNEACTAKVTSIYNNDHIDHVIGYAIKNGIPEFRGKINREILETWNNDGEVQDVVLEGDLDGIKHKKAVLVVHDTPGVNYADNNVHKKITVNHLNSVKPSIVLCLIDATQLGTIDFTNSLFLLPKNNTKIIFILNKADEFDIEKEDINEAIKDCSLMLSKEGFTAPMIIPVSARAARLFKMKMKGKAEIFTRKEALLFENYFDFFYRGNQRFQDLCAGVPQMGSVNVAMDDLQIALFNTGIPALEAFLASSI